MLTLWTTWEEHEFVLPGSGRSPFGGQVGKPEKAELAGRATHLDEPLPAGERVIAGSKNPM